MSRANIHAEITHERRRIIRVVTDIQLQKNGAAFGIEARNRDNQQFDNVAVSRRHSAEARSY